MLRSEQIICFRIISKYSFYALYEMSPSFCFSLSTTLDEDGSEM